MAIDSVVILVFGKIKKLCKKSKIPETQPNLKKNPNQVASTSIPEGIFELADPNNLIISTLFKAQSIKGARLL